MDAHDDSSRRILEPEGTEIVSPSPAAARSRCKPATRATSRIGEPVASSPVSRTDRSPKCRESAPISARRDEGNGAKRPARAAADADYRLSVDDVRTWEKRHGTIPAGAIVLLRTGWAKHWPDRKQYLGDDTPGDASKLHFPSYGKESAEYLVGQRHVGALGLDTASIDYGPSKDFIVHRIASAAGVPGLENLAHLDQLPEVGAWVIALPMKIGGGSGGPLRAVGLVSPGPKERLRAQREATALKKT